MNTTAASTPAPAPSLPRGFAGYLALLRGNPDVRNIWLAQVVSQLGDWFNIVALLGLINQITRDPIAPALVTVFTVLPSALASLTFGGYIADRVDRKKLAIGVDLLRAAVALALLLVHTPGTLWIAYGVIITLSLGESMFGPALSAAQPNLCRPHELATANAMQQSTWASVSMIGAALGGITATTLGREPAFVFNALSFLVSAFFLWRVKGRFSSAGHRAGSISLRSLTAGMRFVWGKPAVLGMVLAKAIWSFTFATTSLYSVFAYQVYKNGDSGTSGLYIARGIGSFIGPMIAQSFFPPSRLKQFFTLIAVAFLLCIAGYGVWAISPLPLIGAIGIFVGHLGGGNVWTFSRIYVQRETPDQLRGRVMALDGVGFSLVTGIFSFVWAAVAQRTSPSIGVLSGVGATTVLCAVWLFWMAQRVKLAAVEP